MPHNWKPYKPEVLYPYHVSVCVMVCVSCGATWDMNAVIFTDSPLLNMSCEDIVINTVHGT